MDWLIKNHVCELGFAENTLVQVLLNEFSLYRHGSSVQLELRFDNVTPTIRRRESKSVIKDKMPLFKQKAKKYQSELDAILLDGTLEKWEFSDPDFVFRYGSGGTLPIVNLNGNQYYCLFYRDVDPIGWNIANGGTDSLDELLNPQKTILRELREELIVLDLQNKRELFFPDEADQLIDLAEFEQARKLWQPLFPGVVFNRSDRRPIKIIWINGPDTVTIRFEKDRPKNIEGCFLNINAVDFGIEVDRIGEFEVDDHTRLLDGEIINGRLLDRPIGLFEVNGFHKSIVDDSVEYLPDIVFHSARRSPGENFKKIVSADFLPHLEEFNLRNETEIRKWRDAEGKQFGLCPVTTRIVRRKLPLINKKKSIFVSYSSKDEDFARKIIKDLESRGITCWFAPEDMGAGGRILDTIYDAIKKHDGLLLVLSTESLNSPWVEDEVSFAFAQERKKKGFVLIPVTIDDVIFACDKAWATKIRETVNIGDFRNWRNSNQYLPAFEKLISSWSITKK